MKDSTSGHADGVWIPSSRRRLRRGRGALASLLVLFAFALGQASLISVAATADTPGDPFGDGVQPIFKTGNPSCSDVMTSAQFLFEHKQDPPQDATINLTFGDLSGTLVVVVNEGAQTFSFTLTGDFVAAGVIVKGGSNANFYDYRPDGNAADTGLHAPVNPSNGKFYGLSHISFCLMEDAPPAETPEIDVEKSCPDSVGAGDEIEYTITGREHRHRGAGRPLRRRLAARRHHGRVRSRPRLGARGRCDRDRDRHLHAGTRREPGHQYGDRDGHGRGLRRG